MFYIQDNEQIVLFSEDREILVSSIEKHQPQYKELPILKTKENETVIDFKLVTLEEAEQELIKKEKEHIAQLHLTGADVERGIFKAKGLDFEDIIAMVQEKQPDQVKALKIELKANNFYRGNPYVNQIGIMLGFTEEQLNLFFEDGNYEHLLPAKKNKGATK